MGSNDYYFGGYRLSCDFDRQVRVDFAGNGVVLAKDLTIAGVAKAGFQISGSLQEFSVRDIVSRADAAREDSDVLS